MAKIRLIQTIIIFVTEQRFSLVSLGVLTYGEIAYRKGMWRFQGEYWLHGITGSLIHRPDGCAKLMSPSKGETAVHGCHRRGDMVVRMRKEMTIPRSWYLCFSAKIGIGSSWPV